MADHHEAIISREVFETANALVEQRGKEKGIVKGSDKYQSRYCFSGKIICNENRIPGAQRAGSRCIIPKDVEKPADARIKSGKYIKSREKSEGGMTDGR